MPPTNNEPITIHTINPLRAQKKIDVFINLALEISLLRFESNISLSSESTLQIKI